MRNMTLAIMTTWVFGTTLLLACDDSDDHITSGTMTAANTGPHAGSAASTKVQLNDAQIMSVVATANTGEVEQNKVALERTQQADLRSFAQDMVEMHTAALASGTALAASLMIVPADNNVSQQLKQTSDAAVQKLKSVDDAAFDRTYAQSQVDAHQQVLDLLDDTLLPNAQNQKLKAELTSMRQTVVTHLDRARDLAD